ncbi:MAG: Hsp20/alpha crystallin family protein [Byssovorax sp.]
MNNEMTMTKQSQNLPEKLAQRAAVAPAVDVFENKDELLILADLPGVAKEDLTVNFDKGQLTVEGRLKDFAPEDEPFDFRRTFTVPQGIEAEKISAQLQNGVLRLSLPKPAAQKPRAIEIKAG